MIRFSKPLGGLFGFKRDFFEENDAKLAQIERIAGIYTGQPERTRCKNCGAGRQRTEASFEKLGIEYFFCGRCGHLNGAYEDTESFCAALYTDHGGEQYARNYTQEDRGRFVERMREIYVPKAEFLRDSLLEQEASIEEIGLCDFGAGAGYFVGAAREAGFSRVAGYEPSEALVEFGNACLGEKLLQRHELADIAHLVQAADASVVSFIGVLEHLRAPRSVLDVIKGNAAVNYIFFSVPLFSPNVVFETVFPGVMPRHLAAGHTHLYTEKSIDYFCNEFGFLRASEWWFGLDFADFYRSVLVTLEKSGPGATGLKEYWRSEFVKALDELQGVLDRGKMCSEAHILLRKAG